MPPSLDQARRAFYAKAIEANRGEKTCQVKRDHAAYGSGWHYVVLYLRSQQQRPSACVRKTRRPERSRELFQMSKVRPSQGRLSRHATQQQIFHAHLLRMRKDDLHSCHCLREHTSCQSRNKVSQKRIRKMCSLQLAA